MVVGYARVSTVEQNIERQEVSLKGLGCEKVYIDKISGATLDRPEFNRMMDYVRDGDTLIVSEYNRLSRSTMDLLTTLQKLEDKGVIVKSIKENFDTSTPQGKLILTIFAGLAEFERTLMKQRQAEGIERAKLAGKYKGRQCKQYDKEVLDEVIGSLANKTMTVTKAAELLGVTRATVYNLLKRVGDNNVEYSETGRDSNDDNAVTI